jgi:hypothetical protein
VVAGFALVGCGGIDVGVGEEKVGFVPQELNIQMSNRVRLVRKIV